MSIPLPGDRSVFDVENYPTLHSNDIANGTFLHHVPLPGTNGKLLISQDGSWALSEGTLLPPAGTNGQILVSDSGVWDVQNFPDLSSTYLKLDGSNDPITGNLRVNASISAYPPAGDTGIYLQLDSDAYGADIEQFTEDVVVGSPTLFLYRETSGTGNIVAPMIEGYQGAYGTGVVTGPFIRLEDDVTGKYFTVDKDGNVDIPTGSTYQINGVPLSSGGDMFKADNLSGLADYPTARTNLGLVSGGAGDIWVEKAGDTMTGQLFIDGASDQIQLRVQGVAGQTANLFTVEDSSATELFFVTPTGLLKSAGISTDNTVARYHQSVLSVTLSSAPTTSSLAYDYSVTYVSTAPVLKQMIGMNFAIYYSTGSAVNQSGIVGARFQAANYNNANVYVSYAIGGIFNAYSHPTRASWLLNATSGQFELEIGSGTAHTTETAKYIYCKAATKGTGITITNMYGIYMDDISLANNNYAIYTGLGLNRFGDQLSIVGSADRNQLKVTGFTTQTNPVGYLIDNTSITNAVRNVLQLETQTTGTGANGLGTGLLYSIETATGGTMQSAGRIYASWVDATNATRKAKLSLSAYDTAERLGLEIEASGSAAKIGLFGVTPVVRPTTSVAEASFTENAGGTAVNVDSTFAGYTLQQIAQALQDLGILT